MADRVVRRAATSSSGSFADPGEGDPLRHQHVAGVGLVDQLAERGRVVHQRLRPVGVPLEQGQRGPTGQGQVPVAGFVPRLEQPEPTVEHRAEAGRAGLEQSVGLEDQPLGDRSVSPSRAPTSAIS